MPAALILDDDDNVMAMASPPPPSNPTDETKPLQYGGDITCDRFFVPLTITPVVPLDDNIAPADDDDTMMSDVDDEEEDIITTTPHPAQHHDATRIATASLVPAALEILKSPCAEPLDLLAVLRALPQEPHIQCLALEKLWVLTYEDDQALRVAEGGLTLLLQAMARFPESTRLQHAACEILQNIAALADSWYAHEICHQGGVELLFQAMRNHPQEASLQLCGCITLASLAQADHNDEKRIQGHIRQVGCVDAVLSAKWNHEDQEAVLEGVQQTLEALGYYDDDDDRS